MFSQTSAAPTPEATKEGLQAALVDVAENSLFALVDVINESSWQQWTLEHVSGAAGWLRSTVGFEGVFSGWVDVTVPEALARELGAAFVGSDGPDDLSAAEVHDFAGELANMTCGAWLTRACPEDKFALLPPTVEATAERESPGLDLEPVTCTLFVSINDHPVRVRLARASEPGNEEVR